MADPDANMTALETPDWLDTGNNAWQMTAATFVGLQSVPGLLLIYAGMMKRKWAINSAFMVFYAFACVLIIWVLYAYKMGFGKQWIPLCGVPGTALDISELLGQSTLPAADTVQNFPLSTMVYFQFVFAAITVVLLAGAVLGRMNIWAWMLFVPLWITFSYVVGAFSIWAGGFLFQLGTLDYSGGYVIHVSSGTAGFVASILVGPRHPVDRKDDRPHNIPLVLAGSGILWLGWNGFNGGDPYAASPDSGVAVLNTNICTAMSLLIWVLCDILYYRRPSIIGGTQGMITGLVAITPAAGFVDGWGAICIGVFSGSIPWASYNLIGKRKWFQAFADDTLGVVHTHMVAGVVGGFFTGVFAAQDGVLAFGTVGNGGAIAHHGVQIAWQLAGAGFIIGWNVCVTALILLGIRFILRVPLRMKEEHLLIGDAYIHEEDAYFFDHDDETTTALLAHRSVSGKQISYADPGPLTNDDTTPSEEVVKEHKNGDASVSTHAV